MLVNERHEISSCDDVELGIKRSSLLEFHLAYDARRRRAKTLLVIISGFGEDSDSSYRTHLIKL